MESVNITQNLPESAFFSAEEKVQLLSDICPRHLTKERLKEWLSYRKGTAKDGSARSDGRLSYIKGIKDCNIYFSVSLPKAV